MSSELQYWIAFNQIPTIGYTRLTRLLNYFGNLESAWSAGQSELMRAGLELKIIHQLTELKPNINPEAELEKVLNLGINILTVTDKNYPKLLKEIYSPPPLLYYRGQLDLHADFPLAVVGSRKVSAYGKAVTLKLTEDLARHGLTIVSGLALGVDALAHQACLKAGGKTIAVLGSGLQQIYPAANRRLAEEIIASGGAVVSEFPLDCPAYKGNFPQRNRVIAGLSLGTLITAAAEKSGALITAAFALEQNREVFAVPGSIFELGSAGPNNLIKLGARSVSTATDVIQTLNLAQLNEFKITKQLLPDSAEEEIILSLIDQADGQVDKLSRLARLDISIINSTLSVLEMKGLVKNLGGQKYIKLA